MEAGKAEEAAKLNQFHYDDSENNIAVAQWRCRVDSKGYFALIVVMRIRLLLLRLVALATGAPFTQL